LIDLGFMYFYISPRTYIYVLDFIFTWKKGKLYPTTIAHQNIRKDNNKLNSNIEHMLEQFRSRHPSLIHEMWSLLRWNSCKQTRNVLVIEPGIRKYRRSIKWYFNKKKSSLNVKSMFKNRISSITKHSSHNNVVIFKVNRVIKMYNIVGHSAVKVTTLNHENHTWADHLIKLNHK
jgi:hypothetical protein